MSTIYALNEASWKRAGAGDLIRLDACAESMEPAIIRKAHIELIVDSMVHQGAVHVSGATGVGKTHCLRALLGPSNFQRALARCGYPEKPVTVHPIEMPAVDSPVELLSRRCLVAGPGGSTITTDVESPIMAALRRAETDRDTYHVIWLRELGRGALTEAVQSVLLNLVGQEVVCTPDGTNIRARVSWLADSNLQDDPGTHTLGTFDESLQRRFRALTFSLGPEQELAILACLVPDAEEGFAEKICALGSLIREKRRGGGLLSVPPPTLYGYTDALRLRKRLPDLSVEDILFATLLGHASTTDMEAAREVFERIFGVVPVATGDGDVDEEGSLL